jgi:hypothetical protein
LEGLLGSYSTAGTRKTKVNLQISTTKVQDHARKNMGVIFADSLSDEE